MLRVFHTQAVAGAILIDDIDDGLPNKTPHRLGSTGNPDAYVRDGYANKPKQPCYVPRTQATNPLQPGFINLNETPRVVLSAGKGKISKLRAAGLITVVSIDPAEVQTPTLTTADFGTPTEGDLTLTGTTFMSVEPDISSVVITGAGGKTLTETEITDGGGTVSATSIVIPAALIPGVTVASTARVISNGKSTMNVALS
jgi:hypothetical protein